ncbi:MAG: alkaline phosphatase family protein [Planctomycetota bacterium]|nr:alkaline phosphatase family protein [Planctomycetota bacterium]
MIKTLAKPALKVLFFELNEAEKHFLEAFIARGLLPNFKRMIEGGALMRTRIPGWDAAEDKAWRAISPWIIWPSVYTGMLPRDHGIVGFGQDTSAIQGKCVWDVLDRHGISTGVLGSLMSYPPRTNGAGAYYVPESLANTADCFPKEARALQEFCVFSARNYSESFSLKAATAVKLLLKTAQSGVRTSTMLKVLSQVPSEVLRGPSAVPERAMLHSYLTRDAFFGLYERFEPSYASVHMNHIAYMQHRYWRAAEPKRYLAELSATDKRFFKAVSDREKYEERFASWIEKAFVYADDFLGEVLARIDDDTVLLVGTALGLRPFDPVKDIHNPVVRLVHERELFEAVGLRDYEVLHQMNPDVTVNLANESAAKDAEVKLGSLYVHDTEPLFTVQRRGNQVFCELNMPMRAQDGETFTIRHRAVPGFRADFAHHIHEHPTNDQSTAHHKDSGWLLAYAKTKRVVASEDVIRVTDIAPTILSLFGLPAQPWMAPDSRVAFTVTA